ncbi:hypothetical protein SYK_05150 [Pseudodesulfovibrio nedwellii]|uniref:Uncharacterized protein n=1 Tax=Pseudodesulfovibrio nedwellii TaxID=2973072 RepID=A0ABN6S1F2_9BACT|nr:hypothetical protein SYK_05150 [Pseudodesulfovibrio nedwellii]
MSQHNIKRRIRALEKVQATLESFKTAHLGIVKFICTEDELSQLAHDIDVWSLTDAGGCLIPPPNDPTELVSGLLTGRFLLLNGIARVTFNRRN